MFLNKIPFFERGRILKLEMLENLRDFPRDFINTMYQDFCNGILTGCEIEANSDYIIVKPGMVCYNHIIYILKECIKVPYTSTGSMMLLKIRFLGENRSKDFLSYTTQVFLSQDLVIKQDEMELCRFKLKEGARLRYDYISLEDFETEYDTINRIHVPFAARYKSTLMPELIKYFSKQAIEYGQNNPLDSSFCINALQNDGKVSREVLIAYINSKLQVDSTEYTNQMLYEALVNILNSIKLGQSSYDNKGKRGRRILLD